MGKRAGRCLRLLWVRAASLRATSARLRLFRALPPPTSSPESSASDPGLPQLPPARAILASLMRRPASLSREAPQTLRHRRHPQQALRPACSDLVAAKRRQGRELLPLSQVHPRQPSTLPPAQHPWLYAGLSPTPARPQFNEAENHHSLLSLYSNSHPGPPVLALSRPSSQHRPVPRFKTPRDGATMSPTKRWM